jgi:hypothetical protein
VKAYIEPDNDEEDYDHKQVHNKETFSEFVTEGEGIFP